MQISQSRRRNNGESEKNETEQRRARIEEMKLVKAKNETQIRELNNNRVLLLQKQQQQQQHQQQQSIKDVETTWNSIHVGDHQLETCKMQEAQEIRKQQIDAAVRIQALFRAKRAKNRVNHMFEEKHSAILIQSLIRGKKARNKVKIIRASIKRSTVIGGERSGSTMSVWVGAMHNDSDNPTLKQKRSSAKLRRFHYQNIDIHDTYSVYACGLHVNSRFRARVICFVESRCFQLAIIYLILLDCISQAMSYQYQNDQDLTNQINSSL